MLSHIRAADRDDLQSIVDLVLSYCCLFTPYEFHCYLLFLQGNCCYLGLRSIALCMMYELGHYYKMIGNFLHFETATFDIALF